MKECLGACASPRRRPGWSSREGAKPKDGGQDGGAAWRGGFYHKARPLSTLGRAILRFDEVGRAIVGPCVLTRRMNPCRWAAVYLGGMSSGCRRVSAVPGDNVLFFCSWSGGKDSCLALYRAMKAGATPHFLFTMLEESGERSRSHGLPLEILRAQALSLGIPLKTRCASWSEYEAVFIAALQEMAESGVRAGVFGDIDIDSHREWEKMVCHRAGMEAYLPLW
jgi:hypothetical protein